MKPSRHNGNDNSADTTRWDSYARRNDPSNPIVRLLLYDVLYRSCANLLKAAVFNEPISILELGCGPGYVARRIAEQIPTKRLVVVDSSPAAIKISKTTLQGLDCDVEGIEADFFQMNLPEQFDLVYSNGVVEHFDDATRARLLRIHADYVKDGGYCIVHVPTPTLSYTVSRTLLSWLNRWEHDDETPLPTERLLSEVEQTGMKTLKVSYFWRHSYLTQVGTIARKTPLPQKVM
ncbi:MAG: class I SAM-dependent methyltransferase [Chloroflexota bacterium]|nr:class I SAM-dependent methyltransferase [Chloroflexota bacterium]